MQALTVSYCGHDRPNLTEEWDLFWLRDQGIITHPYGASPNLQTFVSHLQSVNVQCSGEKKENTFSHDKPKSQVEK